MTRMTPEARRRALADLVRELYLGTVISVKDEEGTETFICFRSTGEEMPLVPGSEPALAAGTSVFITGYVQGQGGLAYPRLSWLGTGTLDELPMTLDLGLGGADALLQKITRGQVVRRAGPGGPEVLELHLDDVDRAQDGQVDQNQASRQIQFESLEIQLFGEPGGSVRCKSDALAQDPTPDGVKTVMVRDVFESVVLSLYAAGVLDDRVESAIGDALVAVENRIYTLGERAKVSNRQTLRGLYAIDVLQHAELEFDHRLVIAEGDDGAFVSSWSFVSNEQLCDWLEHQLMSESARRGEKFHSARELLLNAGLTGELGDLLQSMGDHALLLKLLPMLPLSFMQDSIDQRTSEPQYMVGAVSSVFPRG